MNRELEAAVDELIEQLEFQDRIDRAILTPPRKPHIKLGYVLLGVSFYALVIWGACELYKWAWRIN